ncbi:hypothetical protein [Spongiimicrobium sp. 3-5]|uniref:hypothetical protein n=1 Tax=Spongiimicrobium sp. 3-5 TaxID=3332596 RepID=UPI00397EE3BF
MQTQEISQNTKHYFLLYLQKLLLLRNNKFEGENGLLHNGYPKDAAIVDPNEDLLEDNSGLLIRYYINQYCHLKVMDYELIPNGEFIEEKSNGIDPTQRRFYYTLLDHKQNIVDIKSLMVLNNFPFLDSDFFEISIPLRNRAKRIKIYRGDNLLISHFIPTSELKLNIYQG